MATQIEIDSVMLLAALVGVTRDQYIAGAELSNKTGLTSERINDAVALLEEAGLVEWVRALDADPYDFIGVAVTPRGRYEYQRLESTRSGDEHLDERTGAVQIRPPSPVGSPYGFTDEDWEIVAEQKSRTDHLIVVLGYQFASEHYESAILKHNVERSFEDAVEEFNRMSVDSNVRLIFRPLAAGYGEHLFNDIARDIIGADIAVFETSDLNPNEMLEMGVALTWGIRVLPIKLQGRPDPPSDVSGQTWVEYEDSAADWIDPEHRVKLIRMIERATRKKGRASI